MDNFVVELEQAGYVLNKIYTWIVRSGAVSSC